LLLQLGNLNESNQRTKDNSIRDILANWQIRDLDMAWPTSIKPNSLGNSALINLKYISKRKSLAEARALFLDVCKDSKGALVPLGFTHTKEVLKILKDQDTEPANPNAANNAANDTVMTPKKPTTQKSAAETSKTTKTGALKVSYAPPVDSPH
jgi:hypothetical protein